MEVIIASKSKEKIFENARIINIGTSANCNFKLDLPFELVISLQQEESGKWRIINTSKSNKVLFRGQPIGSGIEIASLCKLMIDGIDEFISIKITSAGTNPKVAPGSLSLANQKNAEKIKKTENKKTMASMGEEELNAKDIENLYGKGVGVQTKLKIDRMKADIETRRTLISKEISFKCNELRNKLSQNETILGVLNLFIFIVPLVMAYILNDVVKVRSDASAIELNSRILFLIAVAFIIITHLLKQSQFLTLRTNGKKNVNPSVLRIKSMCSIVSVGAFGAIILFAVAELATHTYQMPELVPSMIIFCAFLCIFIGIFSGFTKNIIAESSEELDGYESREDFVSVIKDYQEWINLFVNNITKKKLKDINNKTFNLQLMRAGEYLLGIMTAPFLAYGVSQTLAGYFPEAAGFINITQTFRISPIFLTLATLMIVFAFHCFAISFFTTKKIHASNVIKQDGFSDYNSHGVMIYGVESTKNLQKESKKFFLIASGVVIVEILMNMSYFVKDAENMQSILMALLSALIPTALLIMETNMVADTFFKINTREELLEKVDKDY